MTRVRLSDNSVKDYLSPPALGTITSKSATASSITLLADNPDRKGYKVYNGTDRTLYIAEANVTASATNHSVPLAAGDYYESGPSFYGLQYTGIVTGIFSSTASGASGVALITEFV